MAGCQYRCFGVEVTVVAEPGSAASRFTWHRVPPPPHPHPCPQPRGKEALGVSPAPLVQFNSLTNLGKGLSSHKTRPACVSSSTADGAESVLLQVICYQRGQAGSSCPYLGPTLPSQISPAWSFLSIL